jgi:hypothetical protein
MFRPQTKVNGTVGYRKQIGKDIDLDMVTGTLEYSQVVNKLMYKIGVEMYKRLYLNEQLNFKGIYFQIERRF